MLWKDFGGKQIIENIQVDPIKFDMFILDNINEYTCLQVHVSIEESIQHVTIVGGSIVAPLDLVTVEGKDDGVHNITEFATSCDKDG